MTIRDHLRVSLGDIDGMAASLEAGPARSGMAWVRTWVDRRSWLARELEWADAGAVTADGLEVDVLAGWRLYLVRALVAHEAMLAKYPVEAEADAAAAGSALASLAEWRADIERLPG